MDFDCIWCCFNLNTNYVDFRGSYDECVEYINLHDYDYELLPEGCV